MTNLPPALRENLGFLLLQAFKKVGKIANEFPPGDDLRLFHLAIMQYVAHCPGTTQRTVSDDLQIDASDVTRHIKQLVTAGYIVRSRSANDGRALALHVTDAGTAWLEQRRERGVSMYPAFAGLLKPAEFAQLRSLLLTLIDNSPRATR